MKDLLHDLWYDLRARRLWPVAAALVVALVAVPLLLIEPADTPPPAAQQAAVPAKKDIPGLEVSAAVDTSGSDLEVFKGKDPFRSPASARKVAKAVVAAAQPVSSLSGVNGPSDSGKSAGGSVPSGGGSGSGSGSEAPKSSPPRVIVPKTKTYTYVLDVTFGASGQTREIRGMRRFRMLPSARKPFLVFLGVDSTGKRAVFLVDGRLKQTGEGVCRPSPAECAFLYMKTDDDRDEHFFTLEDGTEYTLQLDKIRKASVSRASARASRKGSARRPGRRATATSSKGTPFVPPVLVDLGIGAE